MVARYKQIFSPLIIYFGKKKEAEKFSSPPILIGGCARSGTTLLLSVLSAHPHLFCHPYELGVFNYWKQTKNNAPEPLRLYRLYRSILLNRIPGTVTRWCEKTPRNVRHIETIFNYYSNNVKFIHIIRDGRDVVLSKHPDHHDYWVSPDRWVHDVKTGLKYIDHPNVLTIFYEDLIFTFQETIHQICTFAGEPTADELINWHQNSKIRKSNAWSSSVQDLFKSSVGKWKLPEHAERVAEFMKNQEAKQLLYELGYHKEDFRSQNSESV